jgi:hypothetical protein
MFTPQDFPLAALSPKPGNKPTANMKVPEGVFIGVKGVSHEYD